MPTELRPLPGRIWIKRDPDETQIGLVLLPDIERKRAWTAQVILHNPSTAWEDIDLTGCRIVLDKWVGKNVRVADREFVVVPERAVLAVYE